MSGWVAGAVAVGTIGGALISGSAAQGAANTQAQAANNATQLQQMIYNQTQGNLQPYQTAGTNALAGLQNFLGTGGSGPSNLTGLGTQMFQYNPANDPEYQFLLKQGGNAITNQASALGGVNSGNTLRALSDYGQNTALQSYQTEFGNWNTQLNNIFNRYANVAGSGQNAAANLGGFGANYGGQAGSNIIGAGNAQAAGQVGSANALSGGLQSIFSNPNLSSLWSNPNTGATGSFSGGDFSGAFSSNPSYAGGGNQYGFITG